MLDVASTAGFPTAGTINVAASGRTTAVVTYTGISGNSLTGCAYVSGSATGTVSTGGAVTLVTSTNSFGYTDLPVEILAKVGQDGVVCRTARCRTTDAAGPRQLPGQLLSADERGAADHWPDSGRALNRRLFGDPVMRLDVQAECSDAIGTDAPYTIYFGTLSSNQLLGCIGIMDFAQGTLAFQTSNWTKTGATASFSTA